MSKKTLLATVLIMVAGNMGSLLSQCPNLTMSLDQLFRTADQHNTSIKSFNSAFEEAQQGISAAKAERLPDIGISASISYLGRGYIMDRDFTNVTAVHIPHFGSNYAIQAAWAVYTGGAVTAGIDLAKLNAEMAKLDAEENGKRVRFMITGYYLQLHCLYNQANVIAENITLTDSLITLTRQRHQEGVVLLNDITRYELQLEQLKLAKTQVENKAKIINHQLLTALGIEEDVTILTTDDFGFDINTESEYFWQTEATANAPALQKSRLAVRMSEQKEKLEKSALLPKIAIVAEDHVDGPITFEIPNLDKNINYWFVGVNISYNLSSLYKDNRKLKKARIATATARTRDVEAAENVENAIQQAYTDYLTCLTELETNKKNVQLATQNYDVIYNRYSNGLALVTDMIDASNQRLDSQLALVNSRITAIFNYYNLKYISGTI